MNIALFIEDKIFRLKVSVDYSFVVKKLQPKNDACCEELYFTEIITWLFFTKSAIFNQVKPQISPTNEIHDEVEVLSILEGIEGIDKKLIFQTF